MLKLFTSLLFVSVLALTQTVTAQSTKKGPQVLTLTAALTKALTESDQFTLFAPSDEAFMESGVDLASLTPAQLKNVLAYHVIPGVRVLSSDLAPIQRVPSAQGGELEIVKKKSVKVNGAKVIFADLLTGGGVVHVIDRLLLPPPTTPVVTPSLPTPVETTSDAVTIAEAAMATPELSVLAAVLELPAYKPIVEALSSAGPFTVFAPTNEAFSRAGIDPLQTDVVTQVLMYHVIAGAAVYSTDLQEGTHFNVDTFEGSPLQVKKGSDGVTVNGVNVVYADVAASNGVVHLIDEVLIPPTIGMKGETETIPLESARTRIEEAVVEGSRLYDSGSIQACADIYEDTATFLVSMLADGAVKEVLVAGLESSEDKSAATKAWILRKAFDAVTDSPMPESSIVENAVNADALSTLVAVLTMPSYAPVLSALLGDGPFTVFAPTNAAFEAAGVDVNNVEAVTEVLKYHVIPGVAAYSVGLASSQDVPTFQGDTVSINVQGLNRRVRVNGSANVVIADILADNGVVHVIDEVLMPPASYSYPIPMAEAQTIISDAIMEGAPLYNAGDIEGCARVYRRAASQLVSLLPLGAARDILSAALESSAGQGSQRQAWLLRSAFDAVRNSPMPTSTIVSNAIASSDLSTLVDVLTMPEYAPVLQALSSGGPFTVFAPTNAAFAAAGVDVSDVEAVTEVLKYHVIPGVAAYSVGLAGFQSVPTLQGSTVDVTATGYNRMVKVNDANVVAADVLASDGVVHVIDSVLLPPAAMEPQVTYLTRG